MKRIFLALTLSALAAPPALACDGHEGCTSAKCGIDEHNATAFGDLLPDGATATLSVEGMKCGGCSSRIADALKKVDGVNGGVINHAEGKATINFDTSKTSVDALAKVVANAGDGYKVKVL